MGTTPSGAATDPLPNLWAGGLRSYGFGVRTGLGSKPMRYLLGRRFTGEPAAVADTLLFVVEPSVLYGTYVHIAEDSVAGSCVVHTYLPTMKRPLLVAEKLMFDCLPLTDVGYVDLMAWRPPTLTAGDDLAAPGTRVFRFDGDPELPPLWVHEETDSGLLVRRTFWRAGVELRRWEITEADDPDCVGLPRGIRVCRPHTGHRTEFTRFTPPVPVPAELFDAGPGDLRSWLVAALDDPAGQRASA